MDIDKGPMACFSFCLPLFFFFLLEGAGGVYTSGKEKKVFIRFELFCALGKKFFLLELGKDMKCKQVSAYIYIF